MATEIETEKKERTEAQKILLFDKLMDALNDGSGIMLIIGREDNLNMTISCLTEKQIRQITGNLVERNLPPFFKDLFKPKND